MPVSLQTELDEVLSLDPKAVNAHCQGLYDKCAGQLGDRIVLFGASDLGRRTLAGLRSLGIEPLAFADNDPRKWGGKVNGLSVCSRAEAVRRWGDRATFVVTIYHGTQVRNQLRDEGCAVVVPTSYLYWKYADTFLPFGGISWAEETLNHADEIRNAASLWADAHSQRVFTSQLQLRTSLDYSILPPPSPVEETYFPPEIVLRSNELFVDCGAFDGDSIEAFMARDTDGTGRAIAIEPDPTNCSALRYRVECRGWEERVAIHNVAASSKSGELRFDAIGSAGSAVSESGSMTAPCKKLDDLLAHEPVTFIKMDIEGAELDALKGASHTIKTQRPVLAICLYHKPEDLWQIPIYVDSLGCGYKLYLRAHAGECWELVMYAVPADREMLVGN